MRRSRLPVFCIFVIVLCAAFVGCSSLTLQQYVDDNKAAVTNQVNSVAGDMFEFDLFARDNAVVYSYKYKDIPKEDVDLDLLDKALEEQSSVFKDVIKEMESLGIKSSSVVVEYKDSSGDLIYSKKFE